MSEKPVEPQSMFGTVVPHSIEQEITQSYIDYAMSVIVSRALPDTRDGFKPVLRRILYAMRNVGLRANGRYRKSATVVWEVLGKYHPHGDSSVYEAMVRMAQPFSLRYPLIDGQGNFWSIDGDGAAAMRYTEAKLTPIAEEMLLDIEQNTIDRKDNFDGSLQEPVTLPTKFPNHLCNGTMGIAVGMATNMPPHNLTEVLDAVMMLIDKEAKVGKDGQAYETSIEEIMQIIKGPDFPTGGYIYDSANILEVYKKGKGSIVMRGKTHVEEAKNGKIIVIDEIPYLVNKATLVAKIGELVVDKKIEWVTDIRDESSKNIMRVAIYIKSEIDPYSILVQLYKQTDLQSNFNINNVSLVENGLQPRLLNIKDLLMEFVSFRRSVVYRRSIFQLAKAQDRLHILEGLKKAIDVIDEVIETIKKSDTKQDAKENLMKKFEFSDKQAEYILLMRLQSLVWLEIQRVLEEIEEKKKLIAYLEDIINNPSRLDEVVKEELEYMKKTYGDVRRTELVEDTSVYNLQASLKELLKQADMVKEDVILWISNDYQIRVLYQSRIQVIPDETVNLVYTHNQDKLIVITDRGELVVERLKDLGQFTMQKESLNLAKHYGLKGKIVFANTLHFDYSHLVFLTTHNNIKKTKKELVLSFKKFPTVIMKLAEGEKIVKVIPTDLTDHVGIVTQQWWMLIFPESDLRPMGKTSGGVKAIELQEWDKVTDTFLYQGEPFILVHGDKKGKLLNVEDLKIWRRARKGQVVVTGNDKVYGGIGIEEGGVRIRFTDGTMKTLHSNDIWLDDPDAPMKDMVDQSIDVIYRPWEEVEANIKYKLEKKKQAKEAQKALGLTEEDVIDEDDAVEEAADETTST